MTDKAPARIEVQGTRYISTPWLCGYLIEFADKLKASKRIESAVAMEQLCAGIMLEELRWE